MSHSGIDRPSQALAMAPASGSILAWFAHNPVAANLMMLIILVLGFKSLMTIRTEFFPAFAANTLSVRVDFLGGTPDEIEEAVAIKIEEALNGLEGLDSIRSQIQDNLAIIKVKVVEDIDLGDFKAEVQSRIDAISSFPEQAETPVITEQLEEQQVVNVEVFGQADLDTLQMSARRIRDRLLALSSVNKVDTRGAAEYEINIEVSDAVLEEYHLTLTELAEKISASSLNLSSGQIQTESGNISVRSQQQKYTGGELSDIVIKATDQGAVIRLGDIATIKDAFSDAPVLSRFGELPSVQLKVLMLGDSSITQAADEVNAELRRLSLENWLPDTVKVETWYDNSKIIRSRLELMGSNAFSGILLVLLMLAIFLNIRVALWVAIGIPVSFAGAFFLIGPQVMNTSLNVLSTFGFIVVLGIVVDDAIVIGESIYSAKQAADPDDDPVEVAIMGASKVSVPATFGVLTTVAAFFPLTMIESQMGDAFGVIAIVVIFCLLFSLVESKWILPAHLAKLKLPTGDHGSQNIWGRFQFQVDRYLQGFIRKIYQPILKAVVQYRYSALCGFLALLVFTIGLVPAGIIKSTFFPNVESDTARVSVELHKGQGRERTYAMARFVEKSALQAADQLSESSIIAHIKTMVVEDEKATVAIELREDLGSEVSLQKLVDTWRDIIGQPPGLKYLEFIKDGPGQEPDIQIDLVAQDGAVLSLATAVLKERLLAFDGVTDLNSSLDQEVQEIKLVLNERGLALGFTQKMIATQLRHSLYGIEVQRLQRGRDEVKVKVRFPQYDRDQFSDLSLIRVRSPVGDIVPLSVIANFERDIALREIQRLDGRRVVTISADVDEQRNNAEVILKVLAEKDFRNIEAAYPGVKLNAAGKSEEQAKAMSSLSNGFMLSLFLIYVLLAIPLKSYMTPFVIMTAIPFGVIGALWGHLLLNTPMSLMSFFGILALSGVVVNDALVLATQYQKLRNQGESYTQAIVSAGISRFRAILLTSLTTFFGLLPLLLETSRQAQFLIPMAISLAFGILFATVIVLLIIPILLGVKEDLKLLLHKREE